METDYQKIGFKAGLEIHQQLEGKKLFCDCPTLNSKKEADIKVERRLRAVAGETGEVDVAARHEMAKGKKFIYESNSEDTCLVEYDEEPPKPINQGALNAALEISLLLNAKVVDEVQVMRKTVVDGSNTSGFQRTALVATDGFIETSKGKVRVPIICLEEEAAQRIEDKKEYTKFRLDRLGIPLIEIGTDVDIVDAEHAKETASILGMILRSTGKVKRGLGTIRQDVNVSIKDGARTEIKGFQDLKSMPKVIEKEIARQERLIKEGKKIKQEVRKAEPDFSTSFLRPMPGAARMYPETDVTPVIITKKRLDKIELPELIEDKIKKIEKQFKLSTPLAEQIVKQNIDFEHYSNKFKNIDAGFIANTLINTPKEIKKRYNVEVDVVKFIDGIFERLNKGEITKDAVIDILVDLGKGKEVDYSRFKGASADDVEKEIEKIVKAKPGLSIGAYMGLVMAKFKGKIDGKKAMEILKKYVK
ncbi:Glu-tRNA(Gln) amidotransferase subunit GatE [Candidatus Woesearchaeota archaeon]|nr:Glu-tRNA(Gln) amidotransferase subunit GatE [Candidatus Woesearchaeota archaeon]